MPSDQEYREDLLRRMEERRRPGPRVQAPASVRALRPSVYETLPPSVEQRIEAETAQARLVMLSALLGGPESAEALQRKAVRQGARVEQVQVAFSRLVRAKEIETTEGTSGRSSTLVKWRLTSRGRAAAGGDGL